MSLYFDAERFASLFPDARPDDQSMLPLLYTLMDATYRVKAPAWSGNTLNVTIDHLRGMDFDDHLYLQVTFGPDASVQAVTGIWNAGELFQPIPDSVIEDVDKAAQAAVIALDIVMVLVAVEAILSAPETAGVSLAIAAELEEELEEDKKGVEDADKLFDAGCKLYNKLLPVLLNLSDNGGRLYTAVVAVHTFHRLASCVSAR